MVGVSSPNFNPFDPKAEFLDAMRSRGLALRPSNICAQMVIFTDAMFPRKAPPALYDGGYCLHLHDNWASGWFKNWIDGRGVESWNSYQDRNALTPKEWQEIRRRRNTHGPNTRLSLPNYVCLAQKARSMWNDARKHRAVTPTASANVSNPMV